MTNWAAVEWALDVEGPSPGARVILAHLARIAGPDGAVAVSKVELSERSHIPISTVKRQLAELVALSLIARHPQCRTGNRQASNLYVIALPTHAVRGPSEGSISGAQNEPLTPPKEYIKPPGTLSPSSTVSLPSSTSLASAVEIDDLTKQARVIAGLPATSRKPDRWAADRAEVEGWLRAGCTPDRMLEIIRDCQARWGDRTGSLRRFDTEVRRDLLGSAPATNLDAAFRDDNLRAVVRLWRNGDLRWGEEQRQVYGAPPGEPGCRIAPAILTEMGIQPSSRAA